MAGKELLDITRQSLGEREEIPEEIAHKLIAIREKVLMIFERPNKTLYWYIATEFTDLWHGKKQTINTLLWFYKL